MGNMTIAEQKELIHKYNETNEAVQWWEKILLEE